MSKLFQPLNAGELTLKHRVALAPLTRNRASEPGLIPQDDVVEYYRQRAQGSNGGLLISEAVNISPESLAYPSTPGIWTEEQVNGWKRVTAAVHEEGSVITCQLWHTGRVAHPDFASHPSVRNLPAPSVSASATVWKGKSATYNGVLPNQPPRALRIEEIPRLLNDYRTACENAKRAGFDGVELHAAHGYLIDQFLSDNINKRTDAYGGSIANRSRLLFQVVDVLCEVMGNGRVGIRLSPTGKFPYFGAKDSDPDALYGAVIQGLDGYNLMYLLITEPRWWGGKAHNNPEQDPGFDMPIINASKYRKMYKGTMIGAGGFTPATARQAVDQGLYDAIAFGRWFISNPDLPKRLATGAKLNRYDRASFYSPGPAGYIDYPDMDATVGVAGKYELIEQSAIGTSLKASKL